MGKFPVYVPVMISHDDAIALAKTAEALKTNRSEVLRSLISSLSLHRSRQALQSSSEDV